MNHISIFWKITVTVLVVALVVLASLLTLYIVPLKSTVASSIRWQSGSGSWDGAKPFGEVIQSLVYAFSCPPSNAVGNETISFVWNSSLNKTNGALEVIYGFPIQHAVPYGVNASAGGYSFSLGPDSPLCQGYWFVGFYNALPYRVAWSLAFFYNYTTEVPIL